MSKKEIPEYTEELAIRVEANADALVAVGDKEESGKTVCKSLHTLLSVV